MKKLTSIILAITIAATISACSSKPSKPVDPSRPKGKVDMVIVKVRTAPEDCEKPAATGATIGGLIIGGLIGNQFGGGNGKTAATIVGAAVGGGVGSRTNRHKALECKKRGFYYTMGYLDNFGTMKYTTKRFKHEKPIGEYVRLKL